MIEQQVADRFREAVAGEPPLGFDPDDVVDRAIKQGRRRKVVWAVAAATCVEAAVVWAMSGIPGGSGGGSVAPAARKTPPSTYNLELTGFEEVLSTSRPLLLPRVDPPEVMISKLVVRNPNGDDGSVQLKRGNEVLEDISLHNMTEYTAGENPNPKRAEAGVPVTLTVNCTHSANSCGGVTVTVSGSIVQRRHG